MHEECACWTVNNRYNPQSHLSGGVHCNAALKKAKSKADQQGFQIVSFPWKPRTL
jgi:hypothetical protein